MRIADTPKRAGPRTGSPDARSEGGNERQPISIASGSYPATADGTPVSVEAAFRRVRLLVGALVLVRLWTASSLPHCRRRCCSSPGSGRSTSSAYIAERQDERTRMLLGVVQLLADTLVVLLVAWAQHGHTSADSADWAVLVLPAIEGAIRFRVPGAVASWLVARRRLRGRQHGQRPRACRPRPSPSASPSYCSSRCPSATSPIISSPRSTPTGAAAPRPRSDRLLLRTAALGGRRTSRLDVDEILDVIHDTVGEMGFTDPRSSSSSGPAMPWPVSTSCSTTARSPAARRPGPRRHFPRRAFAVVGVAGPRFGARARDRGRRPAPRPQDRTGHGKHHVRAPRSRRSGAVDARRVAAGHDRRPDRRAHALWPEADGPPDAPVESLELFVAQAGASLHNAQVHPGLEELKDRLDHEASHDPLTELANRRRFTEELSRIAGRGRPGDLLGVLFLDLDGFKDVNDRYGHDAGNDLLVAVADRLRECVRPGDLVARLGGDEFTIMLTRLESVAPAAAVARTHLRPTVGAVPARRRARSRSRRASASPSRPPTPRTAPTCCGGPTPRCITPSRAAKRAGRWTRAHSNRPAVQAHDLAANGSRRRGLRPKKPLKLGLISPIPRRERVTMHPALPNIAWRKCESQPAAERARRTQRVDA